MPPVGSGNYGWGGGGGGGRTWRPAKDTTASSAVVGYFRALGAAFVHTLVLGHQRVTNSRRTHERRDAACSGTLGLRQGSLVCSSAGGQALRQALQKARKLSACCALRISPGAPRRLLASMRGAWMLSVLQAAPPLRLVPLPDLAAALLHHCLCTLHSTNASSILHALSTYSIFLRSTTSQLCTS